MHCIDERIPHLFPVPDVLGSNNYYFRLAIFLHSFCCRINENTGYGGKLNLA